MNPGYSMSPKELYENYLAEKALIHSGWEMEVCASCDGLGYTTIKVDFSYGGRGQTSIGKILDCKRHCTVCNGMGRQWFSTERSRLLSYDDVNQSKP